MFSHTVEVHEFIGFIQKIPDDQRVFNRTIYLELLKINEIGREDEKKNGDIVKKMVNSVTGTQDFENLYANVIAYQKA